MYAKKAPPNANFEDMTKFHTEDYISYIKSYYDTMNQYTQLEKYGIGMSTDTPAFPNFYEFCSKISGSSILASELLIQGNKDVVVNWLGGYHHAKKSKASGFCYVNDIVLSILRLLEHYDKVLYVDIDVHHGDGVEEAFYNCPRVLTLSLHQYDEVEKFFPGTGNIDAIGTDKGRYYSVNVPLHAGCTDDTFTYIFNKIFDKIISVYQPNVIWLQCGADSLIGDLIGRFRLSTKAHGAAVKRVLDTKIPIILGGCGGYTIQNVARCWAYETSLAVGVDLPDKLPTDLNFFDYYKEDPYLHVYDSALYVPKVGDASLWRFDKDNAHSIAVYNDRVFLLGLCG
jgi:histone deacetylase 1/2